MDFKKEALLERLVRLAATDVPGTPRAVMKHRSPEELAALQQSVTGAFQRFEDPAKKTVHGIIDKIPHAGTQRVLKGGANMMIENPEMIPMQAIPIPGVSLAYLGAKKGLERGLDRLAPLHKTAMTVADLALIGAAVGGVSGAGYGAATGEGAGNRIKRGLVGGLLGSSGGLLAGGAGGIGLAKLLEKSAFSTNAFSGAMNPVIETGASGIPPFKVPGLKAPVQKVAGAWLNHAALNAGQAKYFATAANKEHRSVKEVVKNIGYAIAPPQLHHNEKDLAHLREGTPKDWWRAGADPYSGMPPRPSEKIAFKLQGHTTHQGLEIAIENKPGSVRKGVSDEGKKWRTVMKNAYGYIKGTKGADGEDVDCYIGPKPDASHAHVVHQHKPDGTGYDEDKVMLGFGSREEARKAYLAHYDDPKFLGPMRSVPMERFKALLESGKKLVKIADAEADNPGQKKPGLVAPAAIAALGGLQVVGVPDAATKMLGYQPIHHGTSNEAAEKIRQVGLDPSMGGAPHGASAAVGDAEYLGNSKGHVHVAPKKSMASDYATIAEAAGEARKSGRPFGQDDAFASVIEDNLKGRQRGSILSGAMPYDEFKKNFHPDPDTSGGLRSAQKVSPEVFKTGLKDVAQKALKDPKSVGSFIKKHPGQFARGAAGIAVPAAMMAGGGMWLHHNVKKRSEQAAQNKTAASSPTRGGFLLASDIPAFKSPSLTAPVEKNGDMLPDYVSTNDGVGFKPANLTKKAVSLAWVQGATQKAKATKGDLDAFSSRMRSAAQALPEGPARTKRLQGAVTSAERRFDGKITFEKPRSQRDLPAHGNRKLMTPGEAGHQLYEAKLADISPTSPLGDGGGNPHRAQSGIPPFRGANLRTPLTKVSEFSDVSAYNGGPSSAGRAPVNEAGFRQAGDLAYIPVNSLRAPLIKRGALGLGTNPMGAASAAKQVGKTPALSGGKGPAIADIAKPKGKGFGGPLPGANKGSIGTFSPGAGT